MAANQGFGQTKGLTGGADKKIFSALKGAKLGKKVIAKEVLWFFGACLISSITGFLVFYLIGEFLTEIFVDFINQLGSLTKFYLRIFLFNLIGVYVARLIVWAVRTVAFN